MTGTFTAINLADLVAPDVVDTVDFEAILAQMLLDLQQRDPAFTALVESDPAYKILEVAAYREMLIRQRVNEAAKAVMLAFATGADLDQIAANYNVQRLVIDSGDPDAIPPVPPEYESDADLRRRVQLAPEGYTVAGSQGAYVFHALGADPLVKDAQAVSPSPGQVTVYVLSRAGNGAAAIDTIDAVDAALSAETLRPMTDNVTVQSAAITEYALVAELTLYPGPDAAVVLQAAEAAALSHVAAQHRMGYDITRSGLFAALHQTGVQNVTITSPAADIVVATGEAAYCTSVSITVAGTDV